MPELKFELSLNDKEKFFEFSLMQQEEKFEFKLSKELNVEESLPNLLVIYNLNKQ